MSASIVHPSLHILSRNCWEWKPQIMVETLLNPIPDHDNGNSGVARTLRELRPAHYTLKIKSFSLLSEILQDYTVKNYESEIFEVNGHKWKLSLYPRGDNERNGEGHISLYLVIAETNNLPLGWEVYVNFKLFVLDQIQDKYLCIQDANGKVRCFHGFKTEWGFAQLLPLNTFTDAHNGYLVDDTCVFGTEISVVNCNGRGEYLTLMKELHPTYTWKIANFSSLVGEFHHYNIFTIGNLKWKLCLYPKGDSRAKGKYLSLFLELQDLISTLPQRPTYVKNILRIVNQCHGQHKEISGTDCFSASSRNWGADILLLTDLHDASKGFLVHDILIVEAEVSVTSSLKIFSN